MATRTLLALALAVFSAACPAALAEPTYVVPEIMGDRLDMEALLPLLEEGELCLVASHEDGRLKQVTAMALVNAPRQKVWDLLCDFSAYEDYMPTVAKSELKQQEDNGDAVVYFSLEVPGPNIDFTVHNRFSEPEKIDIWLENDHGPLKTGGWRWELLSPDPGRTILLYDFYTDVTDTNWIVRWLIKNHPIIAHGVNVGSALVGVQSVKRRAEEPPAPQGEDGRTAR
ncbi:MAG: SRPBCC family protein [Deltaproteobacteria bacterium]|nr:SRPBCC family protein [Deltaproteobacteria bacterium]